MMNKLLLLILTLISLTQQYLNPPYYNITAKYTILTPPISYTPVKKSQINQNYLVRFSTVGLINIWDVQNGTIPTQLNTLMSSYLTLYYNGVIFVDISLNRNNLLAVLSSSTFYILNLTAGVNYVDNISAINGTLRQIQITDSNNVLLLTNERQIILFEKPTYSEKQRYNFNVNLENITKMAKCQNSNSGLMYVAVWDSKANIVLLQCNSIACTQKHYFPCPVATSNWVINHINFNNQCTLMAIQKDNKQSVIIWDVLGNYQKLRIYSIYYAVINKVQFYDSSSKYVIAYSNFGQVIIHDIQANTFVQSISLQENVTEYSSWSLDYKGMVIVSNDSIKAFSLVCGAGVLNQFSQCYDCGVCTSPQVCIAATGSCGVVNTTNTTSNSTNTTNNATNTTNVTNTTNLTANSTITVTENNPQNISTKIESFCQTITHYFILSTKGTVTYSMIFIQISPFIIYFISFINFWTICSLYAPIQTKTPEYLNDLLFSIYQAVYASIFQLIGIQLNADMELQNKLQGKYLENYGISSIFLKNHIQDFFGLGCAFFMLLSIFTLRKLISKKSCISKSLQINSSFIILAQFISIAFTFVLSFHLIKNDGFYLNFKQKLNLGTYIVMISLALVCSSLALFPNFLPCEKSNLKMKKSIQPINEQQLLQLQQKRQIFYNSFSTTFLVLFIMSQNFIITFLGGLVVHLMGIWISKMSHQFCRNKIILSYYLFIFHITYFSLIFVANTNYFNQTIIQTLGLINCSVIIFGAIHQFMFMIYKIFLSIYEKCGALYDSYRIHDQIQKKGSINFKKQEISQNLNIQTNLDSLNNKSQIFFSPKSEYRSFKSKIKLNYIDQSKRKIVETNQSAKKNIKQKKQLIHQQTKVNINKTQKRIFAKQKLRFKYKRTFSQKKDLLKLNNLSSL